MSVPKMEILGLGFPAGVHTGGRERERASDGVGKEPGKGASS